MSLETIPTGSQELHEAMVRLMKRVRDPEEGRKARDDMDRMREETHKRLGTVDVAVELVREVRDKGENWCL